jgi:hypothetical protein
VRLPWLLFGAAALVCLGVSQHGIQPNDEGLMLQAAARIADGQVPYRDFWWFYPPGQPVLLGGLSAALGPSLLTWKVVRALAAGAVAVLAWRLARRGGAPPWAALAAWLAATLALAYPSGPHPFPVTLALCLAALLCLERPALAGALTGVAAFWRLEFAGYLALGVLLAYAARGSMARAAARYAAVAAGVAALLFAPFVALAGPGDAFELLVRYPLLDFSDYQSLPFPLSYDGPLNTSSPGGFLSDSAESLLLFYVPLALVVALAGALACGALRFRREEDWWRIAPAVLALGMLHYLLARADLFHTAPLMVMAAILAAWAAPAVRGGAAGRRGAAAARAAAAVALAGLAFATAEGLDRVWLVARAGGTPLDLPVADGVRVPAATARDQEAAVAAIQGRVPAGAPIYVVPRRSDLVTAGNPLLYVLADRPNPTRYDIEAPGVVTSAPVQREIVADLERTRPRVVIRDTSRVTAAPEPNAAGRSSGVVLLDDYLARTYRETDRFGPLVLLERR